MPATTGIAATADIGTNLFLSKVAMDIVVKHIPQDENGVRIADCQTKCSFDSALNMRRYDRTCPCTAWTGSDHFAQMTLYIEGRMCLNKGNR